MQFTPYSLLPWLPGSSVSIEKYSPNNSKMPSILYLSHLPFDANLLFQLTFL